MLRTLLDDVLRMHRQMKESGVDLLNGRRIARFDGPYRRVIATLYKLAFTLLFGTLRDVGRQPQAGGADAAGV